MYDYYDNIQSFNYEAQMGLNKAIYGRISMFVVCLLSLFVISAVSVTAISGFNYLVIGIGVICCVGYLMTMSGRGQNFPPELILFGMFFIWSLSGVFVGLVPSLVLERLRTLFQFVVMILILTHFSNNLKNTRFILVCFLMGIAIVAASALITGQYKEATYGERQAAGLALNANAFALALVYSEIVLLYFLKTWKSLLLKAGITLTLFGMAVLIIASGSRKGFIGFLLVVMLWGFFSYRKEIFNKPHIVVIAMILFAGMALFMVKKMQGTLLAERMANIEDIKYSEGEGSITSRKDMIKEGLYFIKNNPLLGIGINNFIVRSAYQKYSHNNYIEVTSGTGIPGGILYFSIYVALWLRLRRLGRYHLEPKAQEFINMGKTFLLMTVILDLVIVSYYTKINWILMAIIIGFTFHLEKSLKENASPVVYDQ